MPDQFVGDVGLSDGRVTRECGRVDGGVGDLLGGTAQRIVLVVLYVLAIALFLMGTYVVVTLPNVVPA